MRPLIFALILLLLLLPVSVSAQGTALPSPAESAPITHSFDPWRAMAIGTGAIVGLLIADILAEGLITPLLFGHVAVGEILTGSIAMTTRPVISSASTIYEAALAGTVIEAATASVETVATTATEVAVTATEVAVTAGEVAAEAAGTAIQTTTEAVGTAVQTTTEAVTQVTEATTEVAAGRLPETQMPAAEPVPEPAPAAPATPTGEPLLQPDARAEGAVGVATTAKEALASAGVATAAAVAQAAEETNTFFASLQYVTGTAIRLLGAMGGAWLADWYYLTPTF